MRLAIALALGLAIQAIGCTTANPDFPDMTACTLGERRCAQKDRAVSLVCGRDPTDRQVFLEEVCPVSALCEAGRCQPPTAAKTCQSQNECAASEVCTPLVQPGLTSVALYCVPAHPSGMAGSSPCAKDADCQSYRCLQQSQGKFCLKSCNTDGACGSGHRCLPLSLTVTGVQATISTCSAP